MALPGTAIKTSVIQTDRFDRWLNGHFRIEACFICLFLLFCSGVAGAQTVNGSVYSYFGVGNMQMRSSGYNRAMGYTGIGVRDDFNLNTINPASYNSMARPFTTAFELGASYESIKHQDDVSSSKTKAGNLTSINIMFKLNPKWGVVVGMSPLTTINYRASSTRLFQSLQPSPVSYEGSGGINQFYAGTGFQVFKNFSVGANLTYYLGTVKRSENATIFNDPINVTTRTTAQSVGFDLGAQYTILLKEKTRLTLGATWDRGTTLNGSNQTSIVNSNLDTLKETDKFSNKYRMPPTYGGGVGLKTGRSIIAFDAQWINWQKAVLNDGQLYRDAWKYSMGYEYRGEYSAAKYLNAVSFRVGGFVQDFPIVMKGTPFKTWGYTFGVSLPLGNSSININYAFTQMGTTHGGLIMESSNRLVLDFIIRDVWGIKRKLD